MRVFVLIILTVLTGCVSPGARQPQHFYVLEDIGKTFEARAARASTLLLAPTTAAGFYDTQNIAYSRSPGTRAYYHYHSWTELPARRIGELLAARLEKSGGFRMVASMGTPVRGDVVLTTHLAELYHDAAAAPGVARIVLAAELTDPLKRAIVARKSFNATAPAASFDAPGAVQGFNQALAGLLDEVSAWIDAEAPR
ncbi:MAG TPA: ABC-type transport auxiliary lipoprotein family protein [Burkholderiales bacterium]|nr:ABC-type transport auxiliary lipoprotein family protein [Burkholderiales bacterium]